MTGTVGVTVHSHAFHPVYKKRYRKSKKFLCDPNKLDLYPGDEVLITECKPMSKNKCFRVTEILKAAPRVDEVKTDKAVEDVLHREKKGADAESKKQKAESKAKEESVAARDPRVDSSEAGEDVAEDSLAKS